ncbi:Spy0128 family protein [Christensenella tenuis]|uniref:Streptococcal pilin isopeptide linkage domain-containing protein n=1 Tax=Christensenella tenuis TaxID=2763033 RepID=A0ABR7EFX7_9FIRM|nr:FctA domain-containing protein [Christensenella tenuis]MBC5648049.1 hypothetical protein [Christensenella tenuis]
MKVLKKAAMCCMAVLVGLLSISFSQSAYAANPVQETIQIEQVFEQSGASAGIDDRFSYSFTPVQPGNAVPANASFIIQGTDTLNLGPITYTHSGIFQYEVRLDQTPSRTGYTLDEQVYTVWVYVRESGTNLVPEVVIVKEDGTKTDQIVFTQRFGLAPTDPTLMVDPPVKKAVSGNPSQAGIFNFTLTADDPAQPMPDGSVNGVKTMTIVGSGEEDFGTWSYTKVGTYFYTIAEVNRGENDYTYDTTVYTITDTVNEVNGQLELTRVVTNAAQKPVDSCSFINQYTGQDGSNESRGNNRPKTGDSANLAPYVVLAVVCAGTLLFAVYMKKRKKA